MPQNSSVYYAGMGPELIGILGVGATLLVGLGGLILTATGWIGGWLRDVDQRLARVEGRMDSQGNVLVQVFTPREPVAGD